MDLAYREDIPSTSPLFDYELVGRALASVLLQPGEGATVLGVHGPWGAGKTTLLEALHRELEQQVGREKGIFIWFNAWKFQDREALWRALIMHVLARLKEQGGDKTQIAELEQSLYRAFTVEEKGPWKINWRTLIVELLGIVLSAVKLDFVAKALRGSTGWFGRLFLKGPDGNNGQDAESKEATASTLDEKRVEKLASVLERETIQHQVAQVESIEQFLDKFQALMKKLTDSHCQVFVFVDDLDRCLPESALQIFESIKLFMDAQGCRYIVALDRDVIRKGLAVRYARAGEAASGQAFIDPDEYIEKTISISYDLPRLSAKDALRLIEDFQLPISMDRQNKDLIVLALGTNPRRVKRFMNSLAVQLYLADLAKPAGTSTWTLPADPRDFDLFLKLQLIGYRYSGVFSALLSDPPLLHRLQDVSASYQQGLKDGDGISARQTRNRLLSVENSAVWTLQTAEDFWRLMAINPPIPKDPQIASKIQGWFRYRTQAGA